MEKSESIYKNIEKDVTEKLIRLIKSDRHTESLTAAQMALRELASGNIDSAIAHLRVDLDKLTRTNQELYTYVLELYKQRLKHKDKEL